MSSVKFRGMQFPDEYVIRMFYKEALDQFPGSVIELGCGSANNLMLFASNGWKVTGIDSNAESVGAAIHNLAQLRVERDAKVLIHDLTQGLPVFEGKFDALLAPSVLYYLPRESSVRCLAEARSFLTEEAIVYLRMRSTDDYRCGHGISEGRNAWRIDYEYTGELGALNVFWSDDELIELVRDSFDIHPDALTVLHVAYENVQHGKIIRNSDVVMWGRVG